MHQPLSKAASVSCFLSFLATWDRLATLNHRGGRWLPSTRIGKEWIGALRLPDRKKRIQIGTMLFSV